MFQVINSRTGVAITPKKFKNRQQAEQWAKANLTFVPYKIQKEKN